MVDEDDEDAQLLADEDEGGERAGHRLQVSKRDGRQSLSCDSLSSASIIYIIYINLSPLPLGSSPLQTLPNHLSPSPPPGPALDHHRHHPARVPAAGPQLDDPSVRQRNQRDPRRRDGARKDAASKWGQGERGRVHQEIRGADRRLFLFWSGKNLYKVVLLVELEYGSMFFSYDPFPVYHPSLHTAANIQRVSMTP